MDKEKSLKGLGLFVENIVHLISIGKSETITDIEQHFEDKDVDKLIEHYDNNPEDFSESVLQLLERIDTVTPEGRQLLKKVLNEIAKNENKKENDDNYKMAA